MSNLVEKIQIRSESGCSEVYIMALSKTGESFSNCKIPAESAQGLGADNSRIG